MPCREISKKRFFNFAKQFEILLQGMPLPRKITLILFLILLLTPAVVIPKKIYAQNPWDVFNSATNECDQEELKLRKEELGDPSKGRRISDCRIYRREIGAKIQAANYLLGGPTINDPLFKGDQKGAIPFVGKVIASLYAIPPASGIYYAYDLLNHAGLVKPVYAQGIGFAGLTPFLSLWKASRNISYGVLIIVMLAIGFMVIFRMKIDPKTVISVQAALPKIVLTLIIITLSYPIVGFMIDMMYLTMAIVIKVMVDGMGGSIGIIGNVTNQQTHFMTADIGDLFGTVFYGGFATLNNFDIWTAITTGLIGGGGGFLAAAYGFLGASLAAFWPAFIAIAAGALLPVAIFSLILFLGLLFTSIRLLLLLLNSYIQLIISLILGPILLLQEAIPGRSAFSEWILNIMANLVVFPATAVVLLFATFLTTIGTDQANWMPPFIGFQPREFFSALLGLSTIFLAPNLVAQIKKMFHPKPVLPITAGTAVSPLTGAVQTGMGAASQFYYAKGFLDMFKKKEH